MNPEYVVLGGLLWRLFGKRIGLWYTHKQVNFKLRIAHFFAHDIFTAVKESFTIPSKKVHVVGHGINTDLFSPREVSREKVEIVTVSRIAPIKHIELMIEAIPQIENQLGQGVTLTVISKVPEKSDPYYAKLLAMVEDLGLGEKVHFLGAIPGGELPQYYNRASITLNLTPTGGLDKAVLESLSCGVPVIASNQGLQGLFGPFAEQSLVTLGDSGELVEKVVSAIRMTREERIDLRSLVVPAYAYQTLVGKIIAIYETGK
jgi:glycosyltransferase involved in cell wall biosynthesis